MTLTHWEGEPVRVWEGLWGVPALEVHDRIGSTNDRARELAEARASTWTVVLAEEQTRGRGRAGRIWDSPPGQGLYMSVVAPRTGGGSVLAPVLVGLAVARTIEQTTDLTARVKWPNDVWIGERKVAGVLCEAMPGALVVGVGVNVRQRPEDFGARLRDVATSLELASGGSVPRAPLVGALIRHARSLLDRPVPRLDGDLATELERRDVLRTRTVRVGEITGIASGLDPAGRLRVTAPDGTVRTVVAGHVELLPGGADVPAHGR